MWRSMFTQGFEKYYSKTTVPLSYVWAKYLTKQIYGRSLPSLGAPFCLIKFQQNKTVQAAAGGSGYVVET